MVNYSSRNTKPGRKANTSSRINIKDTTEKTDLLMCISRAVPVSDSTGIFSILIIVSKKVTLILRSTEKDGRHKATQR